MFDLAAIGVQDCVLEVLTARPGVPSITLKWTSTLAPAGMIVFKSWSSKADQIRLRWNGEVDDRWKPALNEVRDSPLFLLPTTGVQLL